MEKKVPDFKDIINLKAPRFPSISPNGEYILFSERIPNWEKNSYVTQLFLAVVKTGEVRQMTYNKKSSTGYRWASDSKSFTFRSNRDGKTQLYRMSVNGGEGKQITKFKGGFGNHQWSPDGKKIAYTGRDEKTNGWKQLKRSTAVST